VSPARSTAVHASIANQRSIEEITLCHDQQPNTAVKPSQPQGGNQPPRTHSDTPTTPDAPTTPPHAPPDRLIAPPYAPRRAQEPQRSTRRLFAFPLTGPYRFRAWPSHTLRRLWCLSFRHACSALASFCAVVWATVFAGVGLVVGDGVRLPGPVKVALAGAVSIPGRGASGPPWHASPSHPTGGSGGPGNPPSIRAS
jgi:hypothetical protein